MAKNKYIKLGINDVLEELKSSKNGLTIEDANSRITQYGHNIYSSKNKLSLFKLIVSQFKSSLMYLLLIASILSYILKDTADGTVIISIILLNAVLGFFQQYRSETAISKLDKLISREIIVIRDSKELLIPERNIVPGDIILLKEGDIVPADAKLFYVEDFIVNESQLTGESAGILKNLEDANSIIYAGSIVEEGEARAIVYSIGTDTELGRIAHLSQTTIRTTTFEKNLNNFSKYLIRSVFIALAIVFITKIVFVHSLSNIPNYLIYVIALSVAVVPEAMPVIITVTLSRGAMLLSKKHVVIKTLSAVEDLGDINILCTDKTGTLTMNKQKIIDLYSEDKSLFMKLAIASLEELDIKRKNYQNPFDKAFIEYIPEDIKISTIKISKQLKELPFDPNARRRRVLVRIGTLDYLIVVGSVETLLSISDTRYKNKYLKIDKQDGENGLRHIAISYKIVKTNNTDEFDILKNENNLIFAGFVSLEDPLRPSTKETINLAKQLGVDIRILSGDSREVTKYVASSIGLLTNDNQILTGPEIDKFSDKELETKIIETKAFARMNPEQKYRVISLLKKEGNIVGYQGDGINDAPSLKLADVAIAVNNATDVAKNSADIILLRQGLSVIIDGIKSGREIFLNINKYIRFTFISNWGNFFALSTLFLSLSRSLPIFSVQILLTSLITDLPCIAIGTDNVSIDELRRPSRFNVRNILVGSMLLGSITAFFEVIFYNFIKSNDINLTSTCLYLFLTLTALVVIFTVRNSSYFFRAPRLSKSLLYGFVFTFILSLIILYIPYLNSYLKLVKLPLFDIVKILLFTLVYFLVIDLLKSLWYKNRQFDN